MVLKFHNMRAHLEVPSFFSEQYRLAMVLQKFSALSCILLFFLFLFFDVTFDARIASTNLNGRSRKVLLKFTAQKTNNFASYI